MLKREFDGLVVVARRAHVFFEDEAHHARLDALAVEFGGDAEDDAEDTVAGFADFQLPHQAELLDQPEFAVELPDDAVQVGHGDEESDRFVVEIGEKDDVGVDNRLHGLHHLHRLLLCHGPDTRKERPRLVVNQPEILGGVLQVVHVDILDMIPRRREESFGAVENPFAGLRDIGTPDKAVLVEIVFEAVILEQLLIIWRVVGILVERLEFVAFDQQSPPVAPLPEVDRPAICSDIP